MPTDDRYGRATTPRPSVHHTCKIRRRVERNYPATTSDECPACEAERDGWHQLLAAIDEVFGYGTHRQ